MDKNEDDAIIWSHQQVVASHFPRAGLVQLQETGLIGRLPATVPMQEIAPLVDALLAAPVLVCAVETNGPQAADLITELRDHAEDLMLVAGWVGAGEPIETIEASYEIGAQFLFVPLTLAAVCVAARRPHIPIVHTADQATAAARMGYQAICAELNHINQLNAWRTHTSTMSVLTAYDPTPHDVHHLKREQVTALVSPLWSSPAQSMRTIITKARQITAAWHSPPLK